MYLIIFKIILIFEDIINGFNLIKKSSLKKKICCLLFDFHCFFIKERNYRLNLSSFINSKHFYLIFNFYHPIRKNYFLVITSGGKR